MLSRPTRQDSARHSSTDSRDADDYDRRALLVLAAVVATFLAGSAVPTPLYDTYAKQFHLTAADVTVTFGVYAVSLLAALLVFGRVSDFIGRRPVLLLALGLQFVGVAALISADGLTLLLVGRVLQGLSTGIGVGAASAALLEVHQRRGGVANAAAPLTGTALGAILAAGAVQGLPDPDQLSYAVLFGVLAIETVLVFTLPETASKRGGALRAMIPKVAMPSAARASFVAGAPVVFSVYALAGFFGSLGPSLVTEVLPSSSVVLTVLPFVLLSAAAPATSVAIQGWPPARALTFGIVGLVAGVLLSGAAVVADNFAVLLVGAVVSGCGFGCGFRGGLQLVVTKVRGQEYAGTVSAVYIAAYLGFGVPAIVAGVVDSATGNVKNVALGYCAVLLLLSVIAALALLRTTVHAHENERDASS